MRLSYLREGEGRDLVFLHGYLASKENFASHIAYFSQFYRVTALDFPGMGAAEPLSSPYSVSDYADWTEGAFEALGIRDPLLIAHSFGGRVAIKLLARGKAAGAVLVGCAGVVPKRGLKYKIRVGTYRAFRKIAPRFAEAHFGSSDYRMLSPVMKESFKKIVGEDLRAEAHTIARPVLFLYGTRDRETPPEQGELLAKSVPGAKFMLLADCGHFAHLENPLAFRLAVEDFYHADA